MIFYFGRGLCTIVIFVPVTLRLLCDFSVWFLRSFPSAHNFWRLGYGNIFCVVGDECDEEMWRWLWLQSLVDIWCGLAFDDRIFGGWGYFLIESVDIKSWLFSWFGGISVEVFLMVREDIDTRYRFMHSWWGWLVVWVSSGGPLHLGGIDVDSMECLRWVWIGIDGLLSVVEIVLLLMVVSGSLIIVLLLLLIWTDPSFGRILLR